MTVLLIGSTSAIVEQIGRIYARRGAELILVARDERKLAIQAADLITRGAKSAVIFALDLNDTSSLHKLFNDPVKVSDVDIAIVGHGLLGNQAKCQAADPSEIEAVLRTNYNSFVHVLSLIATGMRRRGSGTIAAFSSVAGDRGRLSNYYYGSAKAGVTAFLSGLRQDLQKHGVQVLTIKPGPVDTPMTRNFRKGPLSGNPARVAKSVVRAAGNRDVLYTPCYWWIIMGIIRSIPEKLFKRLRM